MNQPPLNHPVVSCREYFTEVINEGMEKTKFYPSQMARFYLIEVMEQFLSSENLFEKKEKTKDNEKELSTGTLAEMLLTATNQKQGIRVNLLKRLGDTSLYISGFLGDSLKYKIIDIDYYADIGCVAYQRLSKVINDNSFQELYKEFATEFIKFMDLLTFLVISQTFRPIQIYSGFMIGMLKQGLSWQKSFLRPMGLSVIVIW